MTYYQRILKLIDEYRALYKKDPGRVETAVSLIHLQEILNEHTEDEINSITTLEGLLKEKKVQAVDIEATLDQDFGGYDIQVVCKHMEDVRSASVRHSWQNIRNDLAKLSDVAHAAAELLSRIRDDSEEAQRLKRALSVLQSKKVP